MVIQHDKELISQILDGLDSLRKKLIDIHEIEKWVRGDIVITVPDSNKIVQLTNVRFDASLITPTVLECRYYTNRNTFYRFILNANNEIDYTHFESIVTIYVNGEWLC